MLHTQLLMQNIHNKETIKRRLTINTPGIKIATQDYDTSHLQIALHFATGGSAPQPHAREPTKCVNIKRVLSQMQPVSMMRKNDATLIRRQSMVTYRGAGKDTIDLCHKIRVPCKIFLKCSC